MSLQFGWNLWSFLWMQIQDSNSEFSKQTGQQYHTITAWPQQCRSSVTESVSQGHYYRCSSRWSTKRNWAKTQTALFNSLPVRPDTSPQGSEFMMLKSRSYKMSCQIFPASYKAKWNHMQIKALYGEAGHFLKTEGHFFLIFPFPMCNKHKIAS